MKVCAIQMDIKWCDVTANLRHAGQLIRAHKGEDIDVFVLPEMFSTGFVTDPYTIGDQASHIEQWMSCLAREMNALIVGSCIAASSFKDNCATEPFYNQLLMVSADSRCHYNKMHLFTMGGEDEHFLPGDTLVSYLWRGVRFFPSVCYDLRFPTLLRNVNDAGFCRAIYNSSSDAPDLYDCLINVANWPAKRQFALDTLLRARAIENQAYVIGCNRVGEDPNCKYQGGTAIISPYGDTLASVPSDTEGAAIADIDMEKLLRFRRKFPVLKDADKRRKEVSS